MKASPLVAVGLVIAGAFATSAVAAGRLHVVHARRGTVRAELRYRLAPGTTYLQKLRQLLREDGYDTI